ncbi:MAG TPA: hypothetical protein VK612_12830 [Pyrinomonadaceae bacterium]|nr:hypothetical protein [Pyrinomonadaceae bacterium]
MNIEQTKLTTEVRSIRELNLYLTAGWVLILNYVKHSHDSQEPRFVVAWQTDDEPQVPELLDAWELNEIDRQRYT